MDGEDGAVEGTEEGTEEEDVERVSGGGDDGGVGMVEAWEWRSWSISC